MRWERHRCIFEVILSKKHVCQKFGILKMTILKMTIFLKRPSHYYTAPPPCRFLQGGSGTLNSANLKYRKVFSLRLPSRGSVVVYIPNGTKCKQENFIDLFEKNHQVGCRWLAESTGGGMQGVVCDFYFSLFLSRIVTGKCAPKWPGPSTLRDLRVRKC